MSVNPIEISTYDFLKGKFDTAPDDSILKGLELHDTVYKKIETAEGVRIGNGVSDFSLNPEQELQEYDAVLIIVCYSLIGGADKTDRSAAVIRSFQISKAVAQLFIDDETMGGRVCRSRLLTAARDFDSINSKPYAVVNLPIVFNETGEINFDRRRSY